MYLPPPPGCSAYSAPSPPEAVEWTRQEIEAGEAVRVTFEWVSQSARYAGTALHGLMQRIAREGLDAWSENAVRSRRGLYQTILQNLGLSKTRVSQAGDRIRAGKGMLMLASRAH